MVCSASARHFSLFGRAKITASAKNERDVKGEGSPVPLHAIFFFARPESEKCFKPVESPTETLATQARKRADRML